MKEILNFDFYIFQQINQFAGKNIWLDALMVFCAKYLEYFLIFFLFLFLFSFSLRKTSDVSGTRDERKPEVKRLKNLKKYWLMVVVAVLAGGFSRLVVVNIIRWLWFRPRPFVALDANSVNLIFQHPNIASFPSGHAAFYFALSAVIYFYNKKAGKLFFFISFLISFARVFSGIHWPLDILVGAIIGTFFGWLAIKIFSHSCLKIGLKNGN